MLHNARREKSNSGSNPKVAYDLLLNLKNILEPLESNITEVQREFLMTRSGKYEENRARVIEIQGGVVVKATTLDGTTNTLMVRASDAGKNPKNIIKQIGAYKVHYVRGNRISFWSRSERNPEAYFELQDGAYVVFQDVNSIFKVKQTTSSDGVLQYEAIEKIGREMDYEIERDRIFRVDRYSDDWQTEEYRPIQEVPSGPVGERLSRDALLAQLAARNGSGNIVPQKPQEKPQQQKSVVEQKPVQEEVMTPEKKREFEEQIEAFKALREYMKSFGPRPTDPQTTQTKKLRTLYNQADEIGKQINEIMADLALPDARPASIAGKMQNMKSKIESSFNGYGVEFIPGYNKNWYKYYWSTLKEIESKIKENSDAQDAIELGMCTEADIVNAAKAIANTQIGTLQKGDFLEVSAIIQEAIDNLTKA
jgi:hypothetical protein